MWEQQTRHPQGLAERPWPDVLAAHPHRESGDPDPARARPSSGDKPHGGGNRQRVLVVDGDETEFARIRAVLRAAGSSLFEADHARSVEAGLRRLERAAYDVCLVAVDLPGRSGLEFVQAARRRDLPVPQILLAHKPERQLVSEALQSGADDLLDRTRLEPALLERSIRFSLARMRQAQRLSHLARHDELTGLANRTLFTDRLERALAATRHNGGHFAVMILDLNGFKAVNDRLGHAAGDELLAVVARRIRERLRETDTVARLGGDEFALLAEDLERPEFAAVVARKVLDGVAPPVDIDGQSVAVTGSLGVALCPDDAQEARTLLRLADEAMYRAKAEGGGTCRFHDAALESSLRSGALLEADLRRAMDHGEIVLLYQPQVSLRCSRLGIAAQVRWRHPKLGMVGPERFLPLAEQSGLLDALTDHVIAAVGSQVGAWQACATAPFHIAVPILSRRQLAWSGLCDRIARHISAQGLEAGRLEIELGEDLVAKDILAGGKALAALRESGLRIALTRFGACRSALGALRPDLLDTLKLDHRLIKGIPDDRRATAIAAALVGAGTAMGLRVVAEGASSQAQLGLLRRHGCDAVQSFMTCPPLPADACTEWLSRSSARTETEVRVA